MIILLTIYKLWKFIGNASYYVIQWFVLYNVEYKHANTVYNKHQPSSYKEVGLTSEGLNF